MRRGTVGSWQAFGQAKWKIIYPWIEERQDGIYCAYCRHAGHEVRSRKSSLKQNHLQAIVLIN